MKQKLPIKISPKRLKDTIVEIRYQPNIPFEYRLGFFYKILTQNQFKVFTPHTPNFSEAGSSPFIRFESPKNIFSNNVLHVHLENERVVFNSNGEYSGWNVFSSHIENCLQSFLSEGLIMNIHRVGLRFISEFEDVQIFDQLKWQFDFPWEECTTVNTSFRTEWVDETDFVTVNLLNNVQRDTSSFSLMDVDIRHEADSNSVTHTDAIMNMLNRLHSKEKLVFFGLMKDEFLQSLNPTYE